MHYHTESHSLFYPKCLQQCLTPETPRGHLRKEAVQCRCFSEPSCQSSSSPGNSAGHWLQLRRRAFGLLPLSPSTGLLRLELIGPAGRFHKAPSQPFPAGQASSPTPRRSGMRFQSHLLHLHTARHPSLHIVYGVKSWQYSKG